MLPIRIIKKDNGASNKRLTLLSRDVILVLSANYLTFQVTNVL